MNPAHYTAWCVFGIHARVSLSERNIRQYRYETVRAIGVPLEVELRLMDELAVKFLKTYQVWHHRRLLLTDLKRPAPELVFITKSLKEDTKNYHTWSYRQWLLAYFNDDDLWSGELDFVDQMVNNDIRNNSAWHHRFFVVFQSGVREGEQDRERIVKRELMCVHYHSPVLPPYRLTGIDPSYVKQNISLAPNNASAWNYLRGVLEYNHLPYSRVRTFVELYTSSREPTSTDVVDLENPPPSQGAELPCVAALEFLADIYEAEGGESIPKAVQVRIRQIDSIL